MQIDLVLVLANAVSLVPVALADGGSHAQGPGARSAPSATRPDVPSALGAADWASIRAAYEAGRHEVLAAAGGHRARNPGQQWTTFFDGRGFSVTPDTAGWSWGLDLVRYGWREDEREVARPQTITAERGRVAYAWDELLTEWYVNDPRGLEHGYVVHERPAGNTDGEHGPLTFTLAVRGELCAEVQADGRGVSFRSGDGANVLTYDGLSVFDADGRALRASFAPVARGLLLSIGEHGARYPLTIDPIAQQAYLKASNTGAGDEFGSAVAVFGDTVVVGAPKEDSDSVGVNGDQANDDAPDSGAVYVFVRSGSSWSQQAYIKASNTDAIDLFGTFLSLSGDTLVVGAFGEDSNATGVNGDQNDNAAGEAGAAYVFVRSGTTWSQQAYLKASNTDPGDLFGGYVSISGDTLAVGAVSERSSATGVNGDQTDDSMENAGAVYVYVRNGTTWTQEAYLKASNTEEADLFGRVSLSGDTLVVGATGEDSAATGVNGDQSDNSFGQAGAAYVYVRNGTTWTQEAYLKASNPEELDRFGCAVSVSGDTLVVGALEEDSGATGINGDQNDETEPQSGAAYAFVRNGTSWSQAAYIKPSNESHFFGRSLCLSANTLVIGADFESNGSTGVNGNQNRGFVLTSGSAYLFSRTGQTWAQRAYLKASNTGAQDRFGISVAVASELVVVGAYQEDSVATGVDGDQSSNAATESGAAYVFDLCNPSSIGLRNGGSNPFSYTATPLVIGDTFTATVDNDLASQVTSRIFAFDSPAALTLSGNQRLLCFDLGGSGELFSGSGLAPVSNADGIDSYELTIPDDPAFCGLMIYSQAIQFGNPPFKLSNTQDLSIGSF